MPTRSNFLLDIISFFLVCEKATSYLEDSIILSFTNLTFCLIGVAPAEPRHTGKRRLRLSDQRQHPGRHSLHVPAPPLHGRLPCEVAGGRGGGGVWSHKLKGLARLQEHLPAMEGGAVHNGCCQPAAGLKDRDRDRLGLYKCIICAHIYCYRPNSCLFWRLGCVVLKWTLAGRRRFFRCLCF